MTRLKTRYRKALLRMGVELYELNVKLTKGQKKALKKEKVGRSKNSLHAKAFVMDRETVFIGSLNLKSKEMLPGMAISGATSLEIDLSHLNCFLGHTK